MRYDSRTSDQIEKIITMSKRGRPRVKSSVHNTHPSVSRPNDNVDHDRENADRIAAAEAMSALSSVVLLPESPRNSGNDLQIKSEMTDDDGGSSSNAVVKPSTSPRRGKPRSRGRGGKRDFPGNHVETTTNQKVSLKNSETKTSKRGRNRNNSASKSVSQDSDANASTIAENLNKMVQKNLKGHSKPPSSEITQEIQSSPVIQSSVKTVEGSVKTSLHQLIQLRQMGIDPTKINAIKNLKSVEKSVKSAETESTNSGVLKLPLLLGEKVDRLQHSPSSVTSNDSVELNQATVDSILGSKYDNAPEASLPLKKRRLQTYQENKDKKGGTDEAVVTDFVAESTTTFNQNSVPSPNVSNVASSKSKENMTAPQADPASHTAAFKTGVSVDPRMSLMLLTEVQMALRHDEDGDLPLHIAVVHENIVMVQKFVHLMSISGKSVDKYNKAQQTPLHLAVELEFLEAVKILLLAGANPNLVNRYGESAFHMAVKLNNDQCLALMLKKSRHKVDINCRDFQGLSPLHLAVMKNYMNSVELLVKEGADINMQDGKSGRTVLFYAVEAENLLMVSFLQKHGCNIEMTNYAGITAIMAAQARGFTDIASMLLRGLDSKSYMEHKEKEKVLIPKEKKVPLPRIPSKSHLIVTEGTAAKLPKIDNVTESQDNAATPLSSDTFESVMNEQLLRQLEILGQQYGGHKFHFVDDNGTLSIVITDSSNQMVGKLNTLALGSVEQLEKEAVQKEDYTEHQQMTQDTAIGSHSVYVENEMPVLEKQVHSISSEKDATLENVNTKNNVGTAPESTNIQHINPANSIKHNGPTSSIQHVVSVNSPHQYTVADSVQSVNITSNHQPQVGLRTSLNHIKSPVSSIQQRGSPVSSIQSSTVILNNMLLSGALHRQESLSSMQSVSPTLTTRMNPESKPHGNNFCTLNSINKVQDSVMSVPKNSIESNKMKMESVEPSVGEKVKSANKKDKPGSKNKVKELKKEDKLSVRSKSPILKSDLSGKSKEGSNSKTSNHLYGSITNINASIASSLQAKLLSSMGNRPLNLSTTDRSISEEIRSKDQRSLTS